MADNNLNSNHKLDENYDGNTLLRNWWPKVKSNFSELYTWLMDHINGTADRHKADDIDYDESITVKQKIDATVSGFQAALTNSVNMEKSLREAGDAELEAKINQEAADREAADTTLLNGINYVANTLIPYKADAKTVSASDIDTVFDTGIYYIEGAVNPDNENELFMIVCNSRDEIVYQYIFYDDNMIRCRTYSNDSWSQLSAVNISYSEFVNEVSQRKSADTALQTNIDTKADKKTATNGFIGGNNAEETDGGAALGNYAKTTSGGAVGSEAESKNGFAGGYNAKATGMGACIGANSHAYHGGSAGSGAQAGNGFAGGLNAKCGTESNGADIDCIQLGTGTNGTAKTLQVYGKRIVEADGSLTDVGNLSELTTTDNTSIVNAIKEINDKYNIGLSTDGLSLYWNSYTIADLAEGGRDSEDIYYIPDIGMLSTLNTDSKNNIVSSINELNNKINDSLNNLNNLNINPLDTTELYGLTFKSITCNSTPNGSSSILCGFNIPDIYIKNHMLGNFTLPEDMVEIEFSADDNGKEYGLYIVYEFSDINNIVGKMVFREYTSAELSTASAVSDGTYKIELYIGKISVDITEYDISPDGTSLNCTDESIINLTLPINTIFEIEIIGSKVATMIEELSDSLVSIKRCIENMALVVDENGDLTLSKTL